MGRGELATARLVLSPMAIGHLPLLVALDADPEVMRFILGRARTAAEAERFWAAKCLETFGAERGLGWWVGFAEDEFVGWWVLAPGGIGSAPGGHDDAAETGWRLERRWWGRGLATEGAEAVLASGFAGGALETVWAEVHPDNLGSRAVMRHLGMVQVDAPSDAAAGDLRYELSRSRWSQGRQSSGGSRR